jgi:CHU_C Type IX secretion signal domain
VTLLQAPAPTSEARTICPGDSTVVFGNVVYTSGTFSNTFSGVTGCDSIHSVTVTLLQAPVPTSEIRTICPGDSTVVFGNVVYAAGTFSNTFSGVTGCDSTHTIEVWLDPMPERSDTLRFCRGDSLLVRGQWLTTSQVVSFMTDSPGLCDTAWTIVVLRTETPPMPALSIEQPNALQQTGKLVFPPNLDAQYTLNGAPTGPEADLLPPGNYRLEQVFEGCRLGADFLILPYSAIRLRDIYAPNSIQPGSSDNGVFTLYVAPGQVESIDWLRIYDRWGALVFEQKDLQPGQVQQGWTGTIRGKTAPPGVYVWQALIRYTDGFETVKSGDISILK